MYCKNCGKRVLASDKFCESCGALLSKKAENQQEMAEKSEVKKTENKNTGENEYRGLTGWLALVGLGLIGNIILQLWSFFDNISIFGLWDELNSYNKLFGPMLFSEQIFSLFLAGASIYLLVLYFKKDGNFPLFYIVFLITNAAYLFLDYIFAYYLTQYVTLEGVLDTATENFWRGVILGGIWIAYMRLSKRVKATFVN